MILANAAAAPMPSEPKLSVALTRIRRVVEEGISLLTTFPASADRVYHRLNLARENIDNPVYSTLLEALARFRLKTPDSTELGIVFNEVHLRMPGVVFSVEFMRNALGEFLVGHPLIARYDELLSDVVIPLRRVCEHVIETSFTNSKFNLALVKRSADAALDLWLLDELDPTDLDRLDDLERVLRSSIARAVAVRSRPSTGGRHSYVNEREEDTDVAQERDPPCLFPVHTYDWRLLKTYQPLSWAEQVEKLTKVDELFKKLVAAVDMVPLQVRSALTSLLKCDADDLIGSERIRELTEIRAGLKPSNSDGTYGKGGLGGRIDVLRRGAELVRCHRKDRGDLPLSHVDALELSIVKQQRLIDRIYDFLGGEELSASAFSKIIYTVIGFPGNFRACEIWKQIRDKTGVDVVEELSSEFDELRGSVRAIIADTDGSLLLGPQLYMVVMKEVSEVSAALAKVVHELALHSLGLLVRSARTIEWSNLDFGDRMQESYFALVYSIRRFNLSLGFKLSTYVRYNQFGFLANANRNNGLVRSRGDADVWDDVKRVRELGGLDTPEDTGADDEDAKAPVVIPARVGLATDFEIDGSPHNVYTDAAVQKESETVEGREFFRFVNELPEPYRTVMIFRFGLFGRPMLDQEELGQAIGGRTRGTTYLWEKRALAFVQRRAGVIDEEEFAKLTPKIGRVRDEPPTEILYRLFGLTEGSIDYEMLKNRRLNHVEAELLFGILPNIPEEPVAAAFGANPELQTRWNRSEWKVWLLSNPHTALAREISRADRVDELGAAA